MVSLATGLKSIDFRRVLIAGQDGTGGTQTPVLYTAGVRDGWLIRERSYDA